MFKKSKASRYLLLNTLGMKTSPREKEAFDKYSANKDRLDELKADNKIKIFNNAYVGLKMELGLSVLKDEGETKSNIFDRIEKSLEYCRNNKELYSELEKDLKSEFVVEFVSWVSKQYNTGLAIEFDPDGNEYKKVAFFNEEEYFKLMNDELLNLFSSTLNNIISSMGAGDNIVKDIMTGELELEQTYVDTLTGIYRNLQFPIPCTENKYSLYYILGSLLNEDVDIKEKDFDKLESKIIGELSDMFSSTSQEPSTTKDEIVTSSVTTGDNVPPVVTNDDDDDDDDTNDVNIHILVPGVDDDEDDDKEEKQ